MKFCVKCICFFIVVFGSNKFSFAQTLAKTYPQNYFRNPLDIPMQLVANFGALRYNHFHMGLDLRTKSHENLPMYAAAEGYISHIKIEKYGFGNAIYISHPNGYTTLYAHLNNFFPALGNYVKSKQYKEESWAQDFELPAGLFHVSKGQFIAYSGNTGGSEGPHLHFEIRDTRTEYNINPLLFGFDIADKKPPVIYNLYWYDRRYSTYQLAAKPIAPDKVVKVNSPLISFGIRTDDLSSSSPFHWGIYSAELQMNDSTVNAFRMDDFSYSDSRYINACIDYSKYKKEKIFVQHFASLPGNKLNIFSTTAGNGVITLMDTLPHKMRVIVKDINGNNTIVNFVVQLNSLLFNYNYPSNAQPIMPDQEKEIDGQTVEIDFSKNSFYDAVPFVLTESDTIVRNSASAFIRLHDYTVPVHDFFSIKIKTTLPPADPLKDRVVMQLLSGTDKKTIKGIWNGDWMTGAFNRLGNIQLYIDTVPPTLIQIGWKNGSVLTKAKTLVVQCKDDMDEVDSFKAELDGKWLLFAVKKDRFIYTFDEKCSKGLHNLTATVSDIAGNVTKQTFTFIR